MDPTTNRPRDVRYRRERTWDFHGTYTEWRVYVDGEHVATPLTKWGAKRLCRQYLAGKPTPAEEREREERWRHVNDE